MAGGSLGRRQCCFASIRGSQGIDAHLLAAEHESNLKIPWPSRTLRLADVVTLANGVVDWHVTTQFLDDIQAVAAIETENALATHGACIICAWAGHSLGRRTRQRGFDGLEQGAVMSGGKVRLAARGFAFLDDAATQQCWCWRTSHSIFTGSAHER